MLQKKCFAVLFPLSFKDLLGDIMASKRDLRSFFVKTDNTNKETSSISRNVSLIIQSSSNIRGETEIQYDQQEIKKQVAKPVKHYDNIPSKIKQETGSYDLIHGTKAAIDRFSKVCTKYSIKGTAVNGWKEKCKKKRMIVNDEMVKKVKDVIIGSHLADKVSSRKMVFVIGTGVVKTNEPKILRKFDGSLEVTKAGLERF